MSLQNTKNKTPLAGVAQAGLTLLELTFSLGIFALIVGMAMTSWTLFMQKSRIVNEQALLDIDVRRVIERFRAEVGNTSRDTLIFYPLNSSPYQAISFALPRDQDGDGLMDMAPGGTNLLWRDTVVYHVWNQSPHQMRRTIFHNRATNITYEARYAQVDNVVRVGNGTQACLQNETSETMILFENLFTGKLWHAEAQFDAYAPVANTRERVTYGTVPISSGEQHIRFTVVGSNPQATGTRRLTIDRFTATHSSWPIETEYAIGNETPTYIGQGLSSAAYAYKTPTCADGTGFELTYNNDTIEECLFIGEGRNVAISNTLVNFDKTIPSARLASGQYCVKLEGQFTNAWSGIEQAGSSSQYHSYSTNPVILVRIPILSDTTLNASGNPLAYGIRSDGFGPVFRVRQEASYYFPSCRIGAASFAIIKPTELPLNSPTVTSSSDFIPLDIWESGSIVATHPNYSPSPNVYSDRIYELRPASLTAIPAGSTLLLQFAIRRAKAYAPNSWNIGITHFNVSRSIPGCWIYSTDNTNSLTLATWSSLPMVTQHAIIPIVETMVLNFAERGDYISHVYDTKDTASQAKTFSWEAYIPSGTTLAMYARSGNYLSADGFSITDAPDWINVAQASSGLAFSGNSGRFVQFRASFTAQRATNPPGYGGLGATGPFCSNTPRLQRAWFQCNGDARYVDVSADILKGPDGPLYSVKVNDQTLVRGVTMEIEIFKDVRGIGGVTQRLRSSMTAEIDPRNSGK